ncbi:hypothetical protein DFH09DRAFT_1121455 [Mycena vulgaris]|nr:hypothetical protein DFH09DRAFT_1121455 [Mycena vulgaris]
MADSNPPISGVEKAAATAASTDVDAPRTRASLLWTSQLESGVTEILRTGKPPAFKEYTDMYTGIYNLVTSTNPPTNANCRDLYSEILQFYKGYTASIVTAAPEDDTLPGYYDAQWIPFSRGALTVERLLTMINKHYVNRKDNQDVKTVAQVAFASWKENVFDPLAPRLGADVAHLDKIRALFASEKLTEETFQEMRVRAV